MSLTTVELNTPSSIDGDVWILCDSAGLFSAFCSAADAARAQSQYGGNLGSFGLDVGKGYPAGDLQKMQIDAIKAAPLKSFFP
jgi:hypothetical protein